MAKIKIIISIIATIALVISGTIINSHIKDLKSKLSNSEYEKQAIIQNSDSLSNVHIGLKQNKIDSLAGKLKLAETIIRTRPIVYIDTGRVVTIEVSAQPDSSYKYAVSDILETNRFKLTLTGYIQVKDNLPIDSKFNYNHEMYPDTIVSSLIFNMNTKLLSSVATVNDVAYESKVNMYDKFYKIFYNGFISELSKDKPYEWYDRFGVGPCVTYNYEGKVLPGVGIFYGFTVREIKELWR